MKEPDPTNLPREAEEETRRRGYEPPRIRWREPYEPISFGISCTKQPGNPPCVDLPKA
jgi:hypothetical protein